MVAPSRADGQSLGVEAEQDEHRSTFGQFACRFLRPNAGRHGRIQPDAPGSRSWDFAQDDQVAYAPSPGSCGAQ